MTELMDCLVNYLSVDGHEDGMPYRYFLYHIVAGLGSTAEAGVASIATLAAHNAGERCEFCETFHAVREGGPAAAIAKAIRHLDAFHQQDRLRKVQTAFRCTEYQ